MMFACVKCVLNAVEAARVLMYTYTVLVFLMHSEWALCLSESVCTVCIIWIKKQEY